MWRSFPFRRRGIVDAAPSKRRPYKKRTGAMSVKDERQPIEGQIGFDRTRVLLSERGLVETYASAGGAMGS
jgi:hypothetical protein